jgi:hypothetical protein
MERRLPEKSAGPYLTRAIAYDLQERTYGGLKPSVDRVLSHAVDETATRSAKRPRTRTAQTGTILIREWQGTAHRVTMLDRGVSFQGKGYRSLSEVTREIIGSAGRDRASLDCDRRLRRTATQQK